jgi:hypothetical protein
LVQNVFSPTMTNHAVQNIHFQLVLVDHKNVILGFDVTIVPTSTNGEVAIIQPLCWYWLVHKSGSTNQYQRCGQGWKNLVAATKLGTLCHARWNTLDVG